MALTDMDSKARPVAGLSVESVRSEAALAAFSRVNEAAFQMPPEIGERILTPRMLRDRDIELYLGSVDGVACATSLLFLTPLVAGIYNVATLPEYRRRGLGEALTAHAVRRGAALGCRIAVLQASQMGRAVYERMGFRQVRSYMTYHRKRTKS